MEKNKITDSIRNEKLQLEMFEKFIYLKVPALCFFISVMCLTKGFQNFTFLDYNETSSKIGFLFIGLGTISLIIKIIRLKLISVDNTNLNVKENILNVAEKRKWKNRTE